MSIKKDHAKSENKKIDQNKLLTIISQDQKSQNIPKSVYRFQFNQNFTFQQAIHYLPYLKELGIEAVYASPFYQARPGSLHGYNITNPNKINPEIGSQEDFEYFCQKLKKYNLEQIIDIVPNHMGIIGNNNEYWRDVLENGPGAQYAYFFDIDWDPIKKELKNKVLLPILGSPYGTVLENQELILAYQDKSFIILYYNHVLPVTPKTYPFILEYQIDELADYLEKEDIDYLEYLSIITEFKNIPDIKNLNEAKLEERYREKEIAKMRLASLMERSVIIKEFVEKRIKIFNGNKNEPASFDRLDQLLNQQFYRISFWQVAAEEINYRRFFNVNELAAIRIEDQRVLQNHHEMIFRFLAEKKAVGLRIDHPDGLYDPSGYYKNLQIKYMQILLEQEEKEKRIELSGNEGELIEKVFFENENSEFSPLFIVIEKILGRKESLPDNWKIRGTVGYEFLNLLNGLFINKEYETFFTQFYEKFIGQKLEFEELIYEKKQNFAKMQMPGEINLLGHYLKEISEKSRHFRDFTLNDLISGIREVVACFPVYRTYISPHHFHVSKSDEKYIHIAVEKAKSKNPEINRSLFDYLKNILTLNLEHTTNREKEQYLDFVCRFQQLSGPIMAKGLEDTVFYIYNRFISLNEVGSDPIYFGVSAAEFHRQNIERAKKWPYSFITSSTHDTKRSSDVRMRLNVISEFPAEWKKQIQRWARCNKKHKTLLGERLLPDRNTEYLIYQTLIGIWPNYPIPGEYWDTFIERVWNYINKAIREAKIYSNWTNPDLEYEEAVKSFIFKMLENSKSNLFVKSFLPFQTMIAKYGMLNSISALNLELGCPGVIDCYQGTELWDYSHVDPDNRRPVDYDLRWHLLNRIKQLYSEDRPAIDKAKELLNEKKDSRIKIFTLWRGLIFRKSKKKFFLEADYTPLEVSGANNDSVIAFLRSSKNEYVIVVSARFFGSIISNPDDLPIGTPVWDEHEIVLPADFPVKNFSDIYFQNKIQVYNKESRKVINLARVFQYFPFAILLSEKEPKQ